MSSEAVARDVFWALAQRDVYEDRVTAVQSLVQRYRGVSPSPNAVMYVRDVEIALGLDLPPVTDADGRNDW